MTPEQLYKDAQEAAQPVATGIEISVYREHGQSGYHNTPSSIVRATDRATGLYAESHKECSQHRNRHVALGKLAKLLDERKAVSK